MSTGYYTTTFNFGAQTYNLKAVVGELTSPVLSVTFTSTTPPLFLSLLAGDLSNSMFASNMPFYLYNAESEGGNLSDIPAPFAAEVWNTVGDNQSLWFTFTEEDKVSGPGVVGRYEKTYFPSPGSYVLKVFIGKETAGEISSTPYAVTFLD